MQRCRKATFQGFLDKGFDAEQAGRASRSVVSGKLAGRLGDIIGDDKLSKSRFYALQITQCLHRIEINRRQLFACRAYLKSNDGKVGSPQQWRQAGFYAGSPEQMRVTHTERIKDDLGRTKNFRAEVARMNLPSILP